MKKLQLFIVSALLLSLVVTANAQNSSGVTATASATVVQNLRLTWLNPLEYGSIIPPAVGTGYACMDISGIGAGAITTTDPYVQAPAMSGGATNTTQGGHPVGPATFLVEGEPNLHYGVELPPLQVIVTPEHHIGPPTQNLALDNFHTNLVGSDPASGGGAGTGIGGGAALSGAGTSYFAVGARLAIPAGIPNGQYTGQFNVRVFYN